MPAKVVVLVEAVVAVLVAGKGAAGKEVAAKAVGGRVKSAAFALQVRSLFA